MEKAMSTDKPKLECRHVMRPPQYILNNLGEDIHFAKIVERHNDGTIIPKLVTIRDYKRDYWITHPNFRNHKQKKSWEETKKLRKYTATESNLVKAASRSLGTYIYRNKRNLNENPYVYGTSVPSTTIIKDRYNSRLGDDTTRFSTVSLDIEATIEDKEILVLTVSDITEVYTVVNKKLLPKGTTPEDIKEKIDLYLKEKIGDKKITFNVVIASTEADLIVKGLSEVHRRKPDFLSIWNMDYDINTIAERAIILGLDPKDIFSDPSIPEEYRYYKFMEGSRTVVTTDGTVRPRPPSAQWHSVACPAHFYVVDAMCTYRKIIKDGNEVQGGFGLDNILQLELGERKLKFSEADDYNGIEWHKFMVEKYPIEYVVYNIWDSLSMDFLEEKLDTLGLLLPTFAGKADFKDYGSSGKVAIADMFFYLKDKGYILGTPPTEKENDPKLLGLRKWIVTLPSQNIINNGLALFKDFPGFKTNIRGFVFDADAVSSYPKDTIAANVSKDTTAREVISVEGIPKELMKLENINFVLGEANMLDYCKNMFNLPTVERLDELWDQKNN